jgi:hypothetical protein
MKKERISRFVIFLMIALFSVATVSCSSNDDESETLIPAGTYVEENAHESELFTLTVEGNTIHWVCTVYGVVESEIDYVYVIKGNQITATYNGIPETVFYKRDGKRITIGEITYIKQ